MAEIMASMLIKRYKVVFLTFAINLSIKIIELNCILIKLVLTHLIKKHFFQIVLGKKVFHETKLDQVTATFLRL